MPHLKRGDSLCVYNTWAHTYVLDAMSMRAARLDRNSPRYRELKSCAGSQVKKLNELASAMGGWGYLTYSGFSKRPAAQPTSFLTGTVLISAWMAGKSFGLSLDNKIFSRALKFLKSQRTPAGTYVYSLGHAFYPAGPSTATPAAWHAPPPVTTPSGSGSRRTSPCASSWTDWTACGAAGDG